MTHLHRLRSSMALCFLALAAVASTAAHATGCEDLKGLTFADVKIKAATSIAAGDWTPDKVWTAELATSGTTAVKAAFCRVEGIIEKEIGFELWLPLPENWNGRFLGAGVGGDAGVYNLRDLPRGVERGYAAATTDTGHKASDKAWMMGDPARLTNYEHRANHLLAQHVKKIIASYYGKPATHAYFIGCSGGGHQALSELQRYPEDYDGIIAGAPGPQTDVMSTRRLWEINLARRTKALMPDSAWQLIAEAGAKYCDTRDGVTDGVAEDPSSCKFDPAALQCKGADQKDCLSVEQVKVAKAYYAPLVDEDGKQLDSGLLPGVRVSTVRESTLAPSLFAQVVHKDPNWDLTTFNAAKDRAALNRLQPDYAVASTNLAPFRDRKGKVIIYSGWMDPYVPAQMTIAYVENVQKAMGGAAATGDFLRLFMAPGVFHCRDGPGPSLFGGSGEDAPIVDADHDLLSALERWVEQGKAPEKIIASKVEKGAVVRTRPLCVYPEAAHYKGSGSTDDAANFVCKR